VPPFRLPLITDQVAIVDLRSNTKVGEISGCHFSRAWSRHSHQLDPPAGL